MCLPAGSQALRTGVIELDENLWLIGVEDWFRARGQRLAALGKHQCVEQAACDETKGAEEFCGGLLPLRVVRRAAKVNGHARLVTHCPGIVSGGDMSGIARADLALCPVLHHDFHPT